MDTDGIDHFRIVDGDRLMWASPETTWDARPKRFGSAIQRRIDTVFPQLGKVAIADVFGGAVGTTVHGMPQIGQLRKGLWVASGFGRQGLEHLGDGAGCWWRAASCGATSAGGCSRRSNWSGPAGRPAGSPDI